ncbi:hypothetical protein [Nitratireductor pacificus]|uniref:Uncharacterized protein n=1 Tax=Nitratireductor pacificus pht-3B TaxID=391937 RepID=K2M769_9HYPH|nr:hypothetical protein [Nitratireductor pacificus]EKF16870.1 hypothetical protein NA2_20866 [Nitratireductor pacificus pht-3B]
MNEKYDTYAVAIVIAFGSLVIGGLMAATLAFGSRDGFLFALGAAASAWLAGYAMFFDRARGFIALTALSVLMALGATALLIKL